MSSGQTLGQRAQRRRQIVYPLDQPLDPPRIPQLQALELLPCPIHATPPYLMKSYILTRS